MNPRMPVSFHLQLKHFAATILFELISCGGVRAQVPNDNFDHPSVISGFPTNAVGTNVGATREIDEPNHHGLSTTNSVWSAILILAISIRF